MNNPRTSSRKRTLAILSLACCFAFNACVYEVPITRKATRRIDETLLGGWTSKDEKHKLKIVRLDDYNYIVSYDGDPFRVYHSDVAKVAFVTVDLLGPRKPSFAYFAWELSDDGKLLTVRAVNDKVVPDQTRSSSDVRKLLEQNLHKPILFSEQSQFTKDKQLPIL